MQNQLVLDKNLDKHKAFVWFHEMAYEKGLLNFAIDIFPRNFIDKWYVYIILYVSVIAAGYRRSKLIPNLQNALEKW